MGHPSGELESETVLGTELGSARASEHFRVICRAMDLTDLLCQPEGKTLEFKRDLSSPSRFLRSVVAFANTAGGTILVGVEDKTRHVRGLSDALAVEEQAPTSSVTRFRPGWCLNSNSCAIVILISSRCGYIRVRTAPTTLEPIRRPARMCASGRPIAPPMPIYSTKCGGMRNASRSTSSRCRIWTRKPWTSELLQSYLQSSGNSTAVTSPHWVC